MGFFGEDRRLEKGPAYRYRLDENVGSEDVEEDSDLLIPSPQISVEEKISPEFPEDLSVESLVFISAHDFLEPHSNKFKELKEGFFVDGMQETNSILAEWKTNDGSKIVLSWIVPQKTCLAVYFSPALYQINSEMYPSSIPQSHVIKAMLGRVNTKQIYALGGFKKTDFVGKYNPEVGNLPTLFHLTTDQKLLESVKNFIPGLPSPNLLQGSPASAIIQAELKGVPVCSIVSVYQTPSQLRQLSKYLLDSIVLSKILIADDHSGNLDWLFGSKSGSKKVDAPPDTYTFGGIYT